MNETEADLRSLSKKFIQDFKFQHFGMPRATVAIDVLAELYRNIGIHNSGTVINKDYFKNGRTSQFLTGHLS